MSTPIRRRSRVPKEHPVHRHFILSALTALVLAAGCGASDPGAFESPEAATQALLDALERDDRPGLLDLFGQEFEQQLITSDWDADYEARMELVEAWKEVVELRTLPDGARELILGSEEWPFPILLVQDAEGSWRFDTAEGIEELIDRRIGSNELTAIAIARDYVDAQIEYAQQDRNGSGLLEYAQRLGSTPGQRDGLYWTPEPGEPESPFGPLVRGAESYFQSKERGDPIQGYFFKILTRQGENPPGGAYDYVIDGRMIAGFALVVWPEKYGESGIKTFVVSHQGKVLEKNLGAFSGMNAYDPDDSWSLAED
jgi:hypothetical protein